ncbi:MAG: hypothetical protein Q7S10_03850 [bacterium]|nr:hypothetical protein [bacterium]
MEGLICPLMFVLVVLCALFLPLFFAWREGKERKRAESQYEEKRKQKEREEADKEARRPKAGSLLRNFFKADPTKLFIPVGASAYLVWKMIRDARHGDYSSSAAKKTGVEYLDLINMPAEVFLEKYLDVDPLEIQMNQAETPTARLIGVTYAKVRSRKGVEIVNSGNDIRELLAGKYDANLAVMMEFIPQAVRNETYLA